MTVTGVRRDESMLNQRFPNSRVIAFGEVEFEIIERGACQRTDLLEGLREDVLRVAAASRGWEEPAAIEFFRKTFKIEPLFSVQALVLMRKDGRLVGLAGAVNDWKTDAGSIVHLCSLGLLPEVQGRGFLPVMLGVLWLT